MTKYRVILRDDSVQPVITKEAVIESDQSKAELLVHAHIIEVLGTVEEPKKKKGED